METAVFIARILGIFYLVAGVGLVLNKQFYRKLMEDFCKSAASFLFGGMLALVIGVVIVLRHNVWAADWTVIITIIGWIALIKGTCMIVFPHSVEKFMEVYRENENALTIHGIAALIFGIVLTFFGFFA